MAFLRNWVSVLCFQNKNRNYTIDQDIIKVYVVQSIYSLLVYVYKIGNYSAVRLWTTKQQGLMG